MQYAIVDGVRSEPVAGGRGVCPTCGAETIAKCGPRVLHHWAHKGRRNCDPWWENETDWHREWKSFFPETCREVHHKAPDGEIHRADVKTPSGIYIEIQHSSISESERKAREAFYGNLLWIVDGRGFRENFDIYHELPDPKSAVAEDIVWFQARRGQYGSINGMFCRVSETRRDYSSNAITKSNILSNELVLTVRVHCLNEIRAEVENSYCGHHQYDWVRPRKAWLESTCPVYIDFGDNLLVKLDTYDASGLPCIQYVAWEKLVQDAVKYSDAGAVCND